MNAPEKVSAAAMENTERAVVDGWTGALAEVFESMADRKPAVSWHAAAAPASDAALLWWEQPFHLRPPSSVWVAASQAAWEQAGAMTLRAAGLETVEAAEARSTWLEILSQSLAGMARTMGSMLGSEVTCAAGAERAPAEAELRWFAVTLEFPDGPLEPLLLACPASLLATLAAPPDRDGAEAAVGANSAGSPTGNATQAAMALQQHSRTMDLLLDIDLPVSISFGKAQLPLKDVLKLTTGSIVELNRGVDEPVEVLVNQCLIARGEVVVVDGNYGVRIQEIASRRERLRSIQ
jgi:flagellar motor switch protein FliN/FliY